MKTKNIILTIASFVLFGLASYGQSSVPTTTSGQPIYTSSDSNYAAFAKANFNYLSLDTSFCT